MKRKLAFFIITVFAVLICNVATGAVTDVADGRCGDDITWSLSDNGILTLCGNGKMWDYGHDYHSPWYSRKASVKELDISEGITYIGRYCFSECSSLVSASIPQTLTAFGENAFNGCTSLCKVNIASLDAWCRSEFFTRNANPLVHGAYLCVNGEALATINIPDSITELYSYTFVNCKNTAKVFIPDSVHGFGLLVFDKCESLDFICFPDSRAEEYLKENELPYSIIENSSTGAGDKVKVSIPPFAVNVFGKVFDSTYAKYPMLFYKDITYYPLTYTGSRNAGITADFTFEHGLVINRSDDVGAYPFEITEVRNPDELYANIASGAIIINGIRMYNPVREYPFLIFRDITYFPLTWDLAKVRFGWSYHFDGIKGLAISR